ncbi:hypothetical protein C9374_013416 [Naegleria lovaniensis]|uniref:Uncharacterized protein n=1 Tax=Naegleria lovaniensis TaxID=51637 RepID=A0AA88H2M3_NAELO|nr:uncharacterized protein C9374_013828 [Naegleria lovaniensis]XP_044553825.1 uncharacterized protein C9374_013416 [Naegleria lovaniensis]KAG2370824.1 hypothetical protein C9374_013828 [Naegleria lovaniensis]KAG2391931.1 hypothetical protein C9374_013416 [Naegleria lovaniensis]
MTRSHCKSNIKTQSCRGMKSDQCTFGTDIAPTTASFNLKGFEDKKKVHRKTNQKSFRTEVRNVFNDFSRIDDLVSNGMDQCLSKKKSKSLSLKEKHEEYYGAMDLMKMKDLVSSRELSLTHNIEMKRELRDTIEKDLEELKKSLKEKKRQEMIEHLLEKRSKKSVDKIKKQIEREGEDEFLKNISNDVELDSWDETDSETEKLYQKLKTSYLRSFTPDQIESLKELERYEATESPMVFKHFRKTKLK